jgi:hypothetical protein
MVAAGDGRSGFARGSATTGISQCGSGGGANDRHDSNVSAFGPSQSTIFGILPRRTLSCLPRTSLLALSVRAKSPAPRSPGPRRGSDSLCAHWLTDVLQFESRLFEPTSDGRFEGRLIPCSRGCEEPMQIAKPWRRSLHKKLLSRPSRHRGWFAKERIEKIGRLYDRCGTPLRHTS